MNSLYKNIKEFEELGYDIMGEFRLVERRYFRKGGDNRTHHIHCQYKEVVNILYKYS